MILNTIKLINFRKFRDETVEFPRGILGIIGKNGVGKSTIFEAVGWALYGNIMSRSAKEEIKSQNASENDICRVELEFLLAGHNYKIIRELKGKNALPQALVFIDGSEKPSAVKDSEVNKYIETLLRMDYNTFIRSVYAKQKDLGSLSSLNRGDRQKAIRRMLNIDKIDSVVNNIRTDIRSKQEFIKGIKFKLESLDELKRRKDQNKKEISAIQKIISDLTHRKTNLEKDKADIFELREKQELVYKKYIDIQNKISKITSKLEEMKKRLTELIDEEKQLKRTKQVLVSLEPKEKQYETVKKQKEAMDDLRLKYDRKITLQEEIKEKQTEVEERTKKINTLQSKLHPLEEVDKEHKQVKNELIQVQNKKQEISDNLKKIGREEAICKSKIKELTEHKENMNSLGPKSECPMCFRKLGDTYDKALKHLEGEIKDLKNKYEKIRITKETFTKEEEKIIILETKVEKKRDALSKKINIKVRCLAEFKSEQKELSKMKDKLGKDTLELKALSTVKFDKNEYKKTKIILTELSKERDRIIALRKEISRLPRIKDEIISKEETITESEKELKTHKLFLVKLKFDEREYNTVKKQYEEISDKLSSCIIDLKDEESNLRLKKKESKTIADKIVEQKKFATKIKTVEEEIQYLMRLENIMIDFRNELINRIRPMLVARASYLFKELTNDRYPILDLDEDYNIYIVDGNQRYVLKRFSGGEEDLANLCLRIAMSQVIAERSGAEINFMALDEIFGSQDELRRSNILNAFNKLVSQFAQIILITHIITIREKLPNVLRVEEDVNKESHVEFE